MRRVGLSLGLMLCVATAALADFQYEQTTKITGGMMAGMARMAGAFNKQANQPVVSTVLLKGNRMARVNQRSGEIIDLDQETITHIDFEKKTYSVMTFAQMKQMMDDAMAKMKQEGNKNETQNVDMQFKASVKETGQSRQVNGLPTQEFILSLVMEGTDQQTGRTGGMAVTTDMWMAAEIPGYSEVREFEMRMAKKLGMILGGGVNPLTMGRPDMAKGMSDMAKEMSKLKGVPVLQVMRMGMSADGQPLPAASEAPAGSQPQGPSGGDVAKGAAGGIATTAAESRMGRLGGLAGGLGGFGRKKKNQDQDQPQQPQQPQGGQPAAGGGILMESTTELAGFSSAPVDGAKLDVPAGFKQVEPKH